MMSNLLMRSNFKLKINIKSAINLNYFVFFGVVLVTKNYFHLLQFSTILLSPRGPT